MGRRDFFLGPFTRALLAVKHVGAGHIVFPGTHQSQLDLILNIFDVQRPPVRVAAQQCINHNSGQLVNQLAHASGCLAVYGDKRLGQSNGNLGCLKSNYGTIAANNLVLVKGNAGSIRGIGNIMCRHWGGGETIVK